MAAAIRRWGLTVALVLAVVPFVVAVAMAVHDDWHPLGDDAAIGMLSHDVLSTRTPLVGMPSTIGGSPTDTTGAHHPGPLLFWALAIPERAAGSAPVGLLVGAALVNAISVVLIGWCSARVAGNAAGVGAIVLAFLLAWALGRQIIVDVWNPYIAIFPLLALIVVTWMTVAGHSRGLWLVALLASFVAQAHLLYVPLGVVLGLLAVAGVTYSLVRRARAGDRTWRRDASVLAGGTLAILVVAWSFPVADQLLHSPGNFTALDRSVRANQTHPVGVSYALRVLTQAIGAPPLFARQGTSFTLVGRSWHELGAVRVASAVAVLGALVAGTVLAYRRRDRAGAAAGTTALTAFAVSAIATARLPVQPIDVARYRLLQLWCVGGFVWFATAVVLLRAAPARVREWRPLQSAGAVAATFVLVAVPIAIASTNSDNRDDPRMYRAVGTLARATASHLDRKTPYVLESSADLLALDVRYGLIRELTRRGFDLRVDANDPYLARAHRAPSHAKHLVLRAGRSEVASPPAGAALLASASEVTPDDFARLPLADDALRRYLREPSIVTAAGRASRDPRIAALADPNTDPLALLRNGDVARLWAAHLLNAGLFTSEPMRVYAAAHQAVDSLVYRLYQVP